MAIDFPTSPSDGQVYNYDGRIFVYNSAGGVWKGQTAFGTGESKVVVQVFTASGTYVPTPGMQYCIIECVGSGAGGGGTASPAGNANGAGSGGGGGGYSRARKTAAEVGTSQTVTISAAGTGGASGNNAGTAGGDVSVGTLCIAKGGAAGLGSAATAGTAVAGGAGGVAGTGDFTVPGQKGQNTFSSGSSTVYPQGGGGASGLNFGFGAPALGTATATTGNAAPLYGGGGGGGMSYNGAGAAAGGAGALGIVIITEYFSTGLAIARRQDPRNRITNPGMRISQQNDTTAGSTDGYYGADQFPYFKSHDGTITAGQVAAVTPGGSTNRLRMTVTGTDVTIGAAQYAFIMQHLEGQQMADALFGTASAKQLVLRFGWKAPAGTYCCAIRNAAADRSYVREFTSTGSDQVVTLYFPGDTSGTWPTTSSAWGSISWCLATGSDYQGTKDQWNAANDIGSSSQVNFIGTNSQVAELFDVGLYLDIETQGVAPLFELPSYDDDLRACLRYWQTYSGVGGTDCPFGIMCFNFSTTGGLAEYLLPTRMRTVPTLSLSAATHFAVYSSAGVQINLTALALQGQTTNAVIRLDYSVAAGLTAGQATTLTNNTTSARLAYNARM